MSRSRNKPENVEIIEYRSEMRRKIDGNIAGVQGVSRIRVRSVCGLISGHPGTSTMCNGSLVLYNIWHILCQMYRRIQALWPQYRRTDIRSTGGPCTKCVWAI